MRFINCGLGNLLCGNTALVTGLETESDGALRVYVGARYRNIYTVIEPDATEAQQVVRDAWACGEHVLIPLPPDDCLHRGDRGPVSGPRNA